MENKSVRLSVNISQDAAKLLKSLAEEKGTTITDIVRLAISAEKFISDIAKEGKKLITVDSDGKMNEIIFR